MSIFSDLCKDFTACQAAHQQYWMACFQTARSLARDFAIYIEAPGAYTEPDSGEVRPYVKLLQHTIIGGENIPTEPEFDLHALDHDGNGWLRFCLSIALENGPNTYPKRRFAFYLKMKIENSHVHMQLLDRSYRDFDLTDNDGKTALFDHMVQMLHITFRCPPEQGLGQQQFGVFHIGRDAALLENRSNIA